MFPFLDPTSPASRLSPTKPPSFPPPSSSSDTNTTSEQLPAPYSSFKRRYGSFPLIFQLPLYALLRLPFLSQAAICVAFAQLALGSSLWIQGQSGESLSVTGLGYLVVFDGLGALSAVVLQKNGGLEKWKSDMGTVSSNMGIQRPYGCVLPSCPELFMPSCSSPNILALTNVGITQLCSTAYVIALLASDLPPILGRLRLQRIDRACFTITWSRRR